MKQYVSGRDLEHAHELLPLLKTRGSNSMIIKHKDISQLKTCIQVSQATKKSEDQAASFTGKHTWPSMPSWGVQSFQLFLPAFNRIPSSGHCSSFLLDRLIPSRIWLGSTIYIVNIDNFQLIFLLKMKNYIIPNKISQDSLCLKFSTA